MEVNDAEKFEKNTGYEASDGGKTKDAKD